MPANTTCLRVLEELRHPAESTAVDSKPSSEYFYEDRMVDGVEKASAEDQAVLKHHMWP